MNIFLIGYRCTGKTTTGKILARLIQADFVDTDQEVEKKWGTSIADMVRVHGWDEFRKREKQMFARIVRKDHQVVATGGGIVLDPDNRRIICANGVAVLLEADAKTIVQRLVQDENSLAARPRFDGTGSLLDETVLVLETRQSLYRECASLVLDTRHGSPEEMARHILDHGQLV